MVKDTNNSAIGNSPDGFNPQFNMSTIGGSSADDKPEVNPATLMTEVAKSAQPENKNEDQQWDDRTKFDPAIFENLPPLLKEGCSALQDHVEREVFLVGALGAISGTLPNVRGFYDGSAVYPNLFVFVVGNYGGGKGSLKYARQIIDPIHKAIREKGEREVEEWKNECIQAKADKGSLEPPHPGHKTLFIPGNTSTAGMYSLLEANGGAGIIFETEGDTIAVTVKSDFGNYSDTLRKAFHHERLSNFKKTENKLSDIPNPRLSLVLSATHDQYKALIPNPENGLYSRFSHYLLPANNDFKDVFSNARNDYWVTFNRIGDEVKKLYDKLAEYKPSPDSEGREMFNGVTFDLTKEQKSKFLEEFKKWKKDASDLADGGLDGSINRLGLIAFRVAMVLTMLRKHSSNDTTKTAICKDVDFSNALKICATLRDHGINIYINLPPSQTSVIASKIQKEMSENEKALEVFKLWKAGGNSLLDITKKTKVPKSTVYRWIKNFENGITVQNKKKGG